MIYCTWGMWVQNHPCELFYPPFTLVFVLRSSWLGGRGDPKISVVGAGGGGGFPPADPEPSSLLQPHQAQPSPRAAAAPCDGATLCASCGKGGPCPDVTGDSRRQTASPSLQSTALALPAGSPAPPEGRRPQLRPWLAGARCEGCDRGASPACCLSRSLSARGCRSVIPLPVHTAGFLLPGGLCRAQG